MYFICKSMFLTSTVPIVWSHFICLPNSVAYLGFGKGGPWRACRVRAYNGDLAAEPPAGSRAEPLVRGQGDEAPLKLKHILLLNVQWKPQIRLLFLKFGNAENHSIISDAISHGDFNRILYLYEKRPSNIVEFCNSCWKTAKNALFHIKSP